MAAKPRKIKPSHRAHIFYSGRVQGVGFRHTAEGIGQRLGLVGWVKNLRDGSVEMVCEGSKEKIESLMSEIQSQLGRHIKKADCKWEKPSDAFDDFLVEFDY